MTTRYSPGFHQPHWPFPSTEPVPSATGSALPQPSYPESEIYVPSGDMWIGETPDLHHRPIPSLNDRLPYINYPN